MTFAEGRSHSGCMGLTVQGRTILVAGRGAEQEALKAAIGGVTDRHPCAWFVHGEPGVGKTRLVAETCEQAARSGFTVLWGRCVRFGAATSPYAPLVTAFEHWFATVDEVTRRQARSDIETIAGAAGGPLGSGGTLRAVARLLARIEDTAPVVLVVDDLQWADMTSLDVLAYLVSGFDNQRMALMVTFRDTELGEGHPLHGWLADLRRIPTVHDLPLARLDRAGTEEQLTGLLGHRPLPHLTDAVHTRSGGNAYLTELLVRDLDPTAESLPDGVPGELREVLLASWHRLRPRTRAVLRLLAVGGRPLPHMVFAHVAADLGHDPSVVAAALAEGAREGVLQVESRTSYWFRHPLLADVLYDTFMPGEAAPEHAAFVRALERLEPREEAEEMQVLADLALHHERSGNPRRAFAYSLRAADCALRLQGHPEAAVHLLHAVELLPEAGERAVVEAGGEVAVLERAAYACSRSGEPLTAHRLVTRALGRIDHRSEPLATTRLLNEWCQLVWSSGMVEQPPLAQPMEAVTLSGQDPDSPEHAVALARLAEAECWNGLRRQARDHAASAVAAAERSGSPVALAAALGARSFVDLRGPRAWADAEAASRWARSSGDPMVMATDCLTRLSYLEEHGRVKNLLPVAAEGFAVSAATGARSHQALFAGAAALHALRLGRFDDARGWLREGLTVRSQGNGGVQVRRAAATLAVREGRLHDAAEHLARAGELVASFPTRIGAGGPLVLAEHLLAAGSADEALGVVECHLVTHAVADPRTGDLLLLWGARAAADLAQQARDAGDERRAADACRRIANLDEVRRALSTVAFDAADPEDVLAPAVRAMYHAELARSRIGSGDPQLWAAAAEACAAAGLAWDEAVVRRWLGQSILDTAGSRPEAAAALRAAHEAAVAMKAYPLRDEVQRVARAARLSVVPIPAPSNGAHDGSPLHVLTPRELEVLGHLVAGRSYSEIANDLVISDKTVSVHVSNLLRKTGTRNRNEAATLARRHGIGS